MARRVVLVLLTDLLLESKIVVDERSDPTAKYSVFWTGAKIILVSAESTKLLTSDWSGKVMSEFSNRHNVSRDSFIAEAVMIDPSSKQILLTDLDRVQQRMDRRSGAKPSSKVRPKTSYSIYGHENIFGSNIKKLQQFLKAMVEYDPEISTYTISSGANFDGNTVQQVLEMEDVHNTLHQGTGGSVTFYHGTSLKKAEVILKDGLKPNKTREHYGDLQTDWSEYNVYLTLDLATARGYATRAAAWDKGRAAVLTVQVEDFTKLLPDEDSMHWFDYTLEKVSTDRREAFARLFQKETGKEPAVHVKWWKWNDPIAKSLIRIFRTILPKLSAKGNLAYKGTISPSKIQILETWKPATMPMDPTAAQWQAAHDETSASVRQK